MMPIRLQPLRIPSGWLVAYNDGLYDIDPRADISSEDERTWLFKEDMLQLTHAQCNRLLDLGWLPSFDLATGAYILVVYEGDFSGTLLHEFRTTDRQAIVAEIERLLVAIVNGEL
jgi:hypothetical protein